MTEINRQPNCEIYRDLVAERLEASYKQWRENPHNQTLTAELNDWLRERIFHGIGVYLKVYTSDLSDNAMELLTKLGGKAVLSGKERMDTFFIIPSTGERIAKDSTSINPDILIETNTSGSLNIILNPHRFRSTFPNNIITTVVPDSVREFSVLQTHHD